MIQRRHLVAASLAAHRACGHIRVRSGHAQQQFFRIGTGGTAGTYIPSAA